MEKFLVSVGERPFMCSICKMTFARRPDLMLHVTKQHKNEKSFSCNLCQKSFAIKSDLIHHQKSAMCKICYSCSGCKATDNLHSCDVCLKAFRYKSALTNHMKVHHCDYCELRFVKPKDTKKHRKGHNGEHLYCSLCKKTFRVCRVDFTHRCKNMKNMKKVRLKKSSSVKSTYSCFLCKKAFEDKHALIVHIEEAYAKNLICCVCKKSFDHKQNVADHFNMHMMHTSVKNFPCGLCWRTFSNGMCLLVHLSIHIRNHKNRIAFLMKYHRNKIAFLMKSKLNNYVPEKVPTCDVSPETVCSPKVETKLAMILKLKPHLVCEVCKETFEQEKHLLEHAKLHTPIPLLTCDVCKGTFTKTQFFNHVKMQTSNLVLFCDVCKGAFTQERHLTMHLHTGEKLFTCTMCKNTFTDEEEILSHIMEVHKRKEPVYCQQCKKPSQKMYPSMCKVDSIRDNAGKLGEDSSSRVTMGTVADLGTGTSQATVNGKRSLCALCDKECTVFRPAVDQVVFCDECEHSSVSCSLCNRNVQFSKLRLHVGQHTGEYSSMLDTFAFGHKAFWIT